MDAPRKRRRKVEHRVVEVSDGRRFYPLPASVWVHRARPPAATTAATTATK